MIDFLHRRTSSVRTMILLKQLVFRLLLLDMANATWRTVRLPDVDSSFAATFRAHDRHGDSPSQISSAAFTSLSRHHQAPPTTASQTVPHITYSGSLSDTQDPSKEPPQAPFCKADASLESSTQSDPLLHPMSPEDQAKTVPKHLRYSYNFCRGGLCPIGLKLQIFCDANWQLKSNNTHSVRSCEPPQQPKHGLLLDLVKACNMCCTQDEVAIHNHCLKVAKREYKFFWIMLAVLLGYIALVGLLWWLGTWCNARHSKALSRKSEESSNDGVDGPSFVVEVRKGNIVLVPHENYRERRLGDIAE